MDKADCLFSKYDMSDIARDFWIEEMPRVFAAKQFLTKQVVPYLKEKGHVSSSIKRDRSDRFEKTYLETKHYYWTLIQQKGLNIVLMRSHTSITAFLLFEITKEETMRFGVCHRKTEYYNNTHFMLTLQADGKFSDDKDDIDREKALMRAVAYLKKLGKGNFYREQIWNSMAVEREPSVELECLFNDCGSGQELPGSSYPYSMFQLSCLHHYM
jgi:hypothetical protein